MPAVLSTDVGFRALGWVVFEHGEPIACGTIHTQPPSKKQRIRVADANAQRAAQLARELVEIIKKHKVLAVVGELPHGGSQSARSARQMAMATAVAATVVEILELPSEWTTPAEVKIALAGSKTASKREMIQSATKLFGSKIEIPKAACNAEHIADACGAYLALKNGSLLRIIEQSVPRQAA